MNKPCTPIPCPGWEEVRISDVQPIGWYGVDLKYLQGTYEFLGREHEQQVKDLVDTIHAQAQDIRERWGYTDDTIIRVKLPDDSNVAHLFNQVKEATDDRIEYVGR
jgi:hypothetical protein